MNKTDPIIFQLYNPGDEKITFWLSFYDYKHGLKDDTDNSRYEAQRKVMLDVKINTLWHINVSPKDFSFELQPKRQYTVLLKPHDDNYFAGWARWFNWSGAHPYKKELLQTVFSDPDYAHLKSETEIGDNFRAHQYYGCKNLRIAAPEDLDGEFEEIGKYFRYEQYWGCESLSAKPLETMPVGLKKIGHGFRRAQYFDKFVPDKLSDPHICRIAVEGDGMSLALVPHSLQTQEICEIAVEDNGMALLDVAPHLITLNICKYAVKNDGRALEFVPDKFLTAGLCKIAVEEYGLALEFVPPKLKTLELCTIAFKKDARSYEFFPKKFRTKEMRKIAVEEYLQSATGYPMLLKTKMYINSRFGKEDEV